MPSSSADRNPVEQLAEEFTQRLRRGERPSLSEYVQRCPEHAAEIRELFPALVAMEQFKPDSDDRTGAFHGQDAGMERHLERLGDYHILREIGRGGMGVVYEAEQVSLGRHVALKVLPPAALLNATFLERFHREARAAGRLHHSNIVPVFGVGHSDGVHYYAMQFIHGEGLDRVLHDLRRIRAADGYRAARPPDGSVASSLLTGCFAANATAEAGSASTAALSGSASLSASAAQAGYHGSVARLGLQVAEALAYAHRHGVLHRDIKPSNLLLDQQGTVWVTDFGLARAEGAEELTQTGDIVGTLRFMAPERFDGQSLPQSDVYALGVTLYELLTLKTAFDDANKARLIEKVLHEMPVPPRKIDPRIPRDLETVVLKCLAKVPAERYASAEAVAEDLRCFLAYRPIRARRTPWHERAGRWCRRNPWVAGLSAALLLVLIGTAVAGVVMSLRLGNALGHAQRKQAEAEAAGRGQRQQLLAALMAEARAKRFSGRGGQRFGTLEAIRKAVALARELEKPAATFDELRNLAIAALALPDLHIVKEWEGWPAGSHDLAFDERVELYARGDVQGNVTVRRVADDVEIARRHGAGPNLDIRGFAEDGRALMPLDLGHNPVAPPWEMWAFTTADRKLLITLRQKTGVVAVYDLATGKHLRDIRFGKWAAGALADFVWPEWDRHPWKHELAIALGDWGDSERQVVRILDLDQGKVQAELVTNPRQGVHGKMSWHPDGRTLAVAYARSVVLWDVPSRKSLHVIDGHKGGGLHASISRSGQLLSTYCHWEGGVRFWRPYTGKPLLSLPSMNILSITPTPDGRIYGASTSGTRLRLWAAEPSPVLRVLVRSPIRGSSADYRRASVHPNGRLLAVGSVQGVSLFDLSRGLDVGYLDLGSTCTAQFDPATGDLCTFGTLGLLRWPVRQEGNSPERLRIGPPKRLLTKPGGANEFRVSRDGRTIAVADESRVVVLHADQPDRPIVLEPVGGTREQLSISPDGRWVATGCRGGEHPIRVFDARTGRLVKSQRIADDDCALVQFTPDGKNLLAGSRNGCRYWNVGDWDESEPRIKGGGLGRIAPEFSPNGKLLAWESGEGAIRLLDAPTGRELVRLESPDQGRSVHATFSPDGRYFIATNADFPAINVWEVRELRQQLRDLDLDWHADPDPPATKPQPHAPGTPPLSVEVETGGLEGVAKIREAARRLNADAWRLVTDPADKRDAVRALDLIQQALKDDPDNPTYWHTLGVVQYRNGRHKEAMATLEKSLAAGNRESDALDLFFLAMCHARLGNRAKAKDCFDQAVRWLGKQKHLPTENVEELQAFRAEAEAVLQGK